MACLMKTFDTGGKRPAQLDFVNRALDLVALSAARPIEPAVPPLVLLDRDDGSEFPPPGDSLDNPASETYDRAAIGTRPLAPDAGLGCPIGVSIPSSLVPPAAPRAPS